MRATRSLSPKESFRGGMTGMGMSSFLMPPGWTRFSAERSGSWYLTRFWWPRVLLRPGPPSGCSSTDSRSRMRRGSSASASWSTRSPVSLQAEKSESAEEAAALEKEERGLPPFSSGEPSR